MDLCVSGETWTGVRRPMWRVHSSDRKVAENARESFTKRRHAGILARPLNGGPNLLHALRQGKPSSDDRCDSIFSAESVSEQRSVSEEGSASGEGTSDSEERSSVSEKQCPASEERSFVSEDRSVSDSDSSPCESEAADAFTVTEATGVLGADAAAARAAFSDLLVQLDVSMEALRHRLATDRVSLEGSPGGGDSWDIRHAGRQELIVGDESCSWKSAMWARARLWKLVVILQRYELMRVELKEAARRVGGISPLGSPLSLAGSPSPGGLQAGAAAGDEEEGNEGLSTLNLREKIRWLFLESVGFRMVLALREWCEWAKRVSFQLQEGSLNEILGNVRYHETIQRLAKEGHRSCFQLDLGAVAVASSADLEDAERLFRTVWGLLTAGESERLSRELQAAGEQWLISVLSGQMPPSNLDSGPTLCFDSARNNTSRELNHLLEAEQAASAVEPGLDSVASWGNSWMANVVFDLTGWVVPISPGIGEECADGNEWRNLFLEVAAQAAASSCEYMSRWEKAVYAYLCGDAERMRVVCSSWTEALWISCVELEGRMARMLEESSANPADVILSSWSEESMEKSFRGICDAAVLHMSPQKDNDDEERFLAEMVSHVLIARLRPSHFPKLVEEFLSDGGTPRGLWWLRSFAVPLVAAVRRPVGRAMPSAEARQRWARVCDTVLWKDIASRPNVETKESLLSALFALGHMERRSAVEASVALLISLSSAADTDLRTLLLEKLYARFPLAWPLILERLAQRVRSLVSGAVLSGESLSEEQKAILLWSIWTIIFSATLIPDSEQQQQQQDVFLPGALASPPLLCIQPDAGNIGGSSRGLSPEHWASVCAPVWSFVTGAARALPSRKAEWPGGSGASFDAWLRCHVRAVQRAALTRRSPGSPRRCCSDMALVLDELFGVDFLSFLSILVAPLIALLAVDTIRASSGPSGPSLKADARPTVGRARRQSKRFLPPVKLHDDHDDEAPSRPVSADECRLTDAVDALRSAVVTPCLSRASAGFQHAEAFSAWIPTRRDPSSSERDRGQMKSKSDRGQTKGESDRRQTKGESNRRQTRQHALIDLEAVLSELPLEPKPPLESCPGTSGQGAWDFVRLPPHNGVAFSLTACEDILAVWRLVDIFLDFKDFRVSLIEVASHPDPLQPLTCQVQELEALSERLSAALGGTWLTYARAKLPSAQAASSKEAFASPATSANQDGSYSSSGASRPPAAPSSPCAAFFYPGAVLSAMALGQDGRLCKELLRDGAAVLLRMLAQAVDDFALLLERWRAMAQYASVKKSRLWCRSAIEGAVERLLTSVVRTLRRTTDLANLSQETGTPQLPQGGVTGAPQIDLAGGSQIDLTGASHTLQLDASQIDAELDFIKTFSRLAERLKVQAV